MLKPPLAPSLFCLALMAACATLGAEAPPPPACEMSAEDQAWITSAVGGWRIASRDIGRFEAPDNMRTVFFDDDCVWTSTDAMSGAGAPHWSVVAHAGTVTLPNGNEMPAGVTSFASGEEGTPGFFVMSTPSVWAAGNVPGGPLGLPTLMRAVLIHEASHVTQIPTYGVMIGQLAEANGLPEDFNDDSMQRRFEGDADFTASIARETELLLAAAAAPDDREARRLASEARRLMIARADRHFVGAEAYYRQAEDVFLTFEGAAQWLAFQWVTSPEGANVAVADAMPGFAQRSRWWSQKQGFALFMVIDRLTQRAWLDIVFGDGSKTALQILDEALIEPT